MSFCVGGRQNGEDGAADSCCIHAEASNGVHLQQVSQLLLLQSPPWIINFWRDASRRGWQWFGWGVGRGGRIERLGSYLWLTPSLSLCMWACCCYFHICPCSGRWAIFNMWSAFVISTDELPCNVIKQEADCRMRFPPLPGYQSQINIVRGTLRWLVYCGCWVWSPSVMASTVGGSTCFIITFQLLPISRYLPSVTLAVFKSSMHFSPQRSDFDCVNSLNVEGSSFGHL